MCDKLITAIQKTACQFKECGMCPKGKEPCIDRYALQAADVIEKLNKQLEEYHKYDSFLAAHGCFNDKN